MKNKLIIPLLAFSLALLQVFALTGCSAKKGEKPEIVLFILVDALRADRVGFMGYDRDTTPYLDKLAGEGLVVEKYYTQSGWTLASTASIFTSLLPSFHQVQSYQDVLDDYHMTIGELFRHLGYRTIGLSVNSIICREGGFAQGFDYWFNKRYDDHLTRYTLSYIDPALPTPEQVTAANLFNTNGLMKYYVNREESPSRRIGYFGEGTFQLKKNLFKKSRSIPLAVSSGQPVPAGRFRWGVSLASTGTDCEALVTLSRKSGSESPEKISEYKITIMPEWKMHSFPMELPAGSEFQLSLRAAQNADIPDGGILVDTPFLIPEHKIENDGKPLFIYMHYMEVHEPNKIEAHLEKKYLGRFTDERLPSGNVRQPPGDAQHMSDAKYLFPGWEEENDGLNWHNNRYDETVLYIDDQVKLLSERLKSTASFKDSMIVFTSDHGQEFFDHGFTGHGYSLYDELLHVPLMIIRPDVIPRGKRFPYPVQSIDLLPTLGALADESDTTEELLSHQMMGRNISEELTKSSEPKEPLIISEEVRNRLYSINFKNMKYISKRGKCLNSDLLFNLKKDPGEKTDIIMSREYSGLINSFKSHIQKHRELVQDYQSGRERKERATDSELEENLVRLGYINPSFVTPRNSDLDCIIATFRYLFYMFSNAP